MSPEILPGLCRVPGFCSGMLRFILICQAVLFQIVPIGRPAASTNLSRKRSVLNVSEAQCVSKIPKPSELKDQTSVSEVQ